MRWKTVALAGALAPSAIGCGLAQSTTRTVVNETCVGYTQHCVHHDLKKQAATVWKEIRCQYPRRAFTAEFHDGFVDGYVDYLDRGGNGSMPAAPPSKYTRHKKYYTENGQCLLKDYFLGFKYGQEIAIATGKRQFLTVPVLLPDRPPEPPRFMIEPPSDAATLTPPMPVPTPPPGTSTPTPIPPPAPVPTPTLFPNAQPTVPQAQESLPIPAVPTDTVPAPAPPVPTIPQVPARGERPAERPSVPGAVPSVQGVIPPLPTPLPKLPAPPAEIPELPDHVPTPPITDDLPVVQPYRGELPVVPPSHPEATGK
ncbi:MAG: hypothetical protein U0792_20220 [Gemmataceae bacterium]